MKKIHRVFAMLMAAIMALSLVTTAFAAEPTIDLAKKASLSIYKYDITKASEDGVWDAESYVSTGLHDDAVIDKLSKYAIQGVEFTYLKVADITMSNEVVDGQRQVGVLYGFDTSDRSNAVLSAIGLTAADAHKTEGGVNYYTSDTLNNKLAAALAANATSAKNALETAVKNGGVAMTETDTTGHTSASNMEQGLYLVVETRVPENVTSTCNPFLISLPMTTIDGSEWIYDLTVYPKNQTGNPDLEKTVRESKNSTGKNNGSLTDIADGYAHTATASVGDIVDYQILSTLPTITSRASGLSEYTYVDTLSKGIRYHKNDVVIEFFRDSACTDKITTWAEDSGKFTLVYDDAQNSMTIRMTEAGLSEINEATTVYTDSVKRGYSDCTMRITYAATLTADAQMGDKDNPNAVTLTWKRTNTTYYDTLEDCCHVYTYGIDVLKQFSDGKGNIQNVKFNLHNDTDNCYIIADLKDGVYYAKGIAAKKADATTFAADRFITTLQRTKCPVFKNRYSKTEYMTPANIERINKLLRCAFKQAVRWDIVAKNPFDNTTLPKVKRKPREIWDAATIRKALDECKDGRLYVAINLSFACSLRIGEIVGLTWDNIHISDVDIANDNAYLCVEKELARVKESSLAVLGEEEIIKKFPRTMYLENASTVIVLKTPKTESSVRKVWMPKTVAYILREWKDSQNKQKEFLGDEYLDYNLVVALPNGRPCEETVISNAFRRLKRDANLPNVVFHSLRHSSTTYKLKLNHGDIKATQGDTGHSQADMVTKVYAHILDEDRKVNAQKFESAFYANPDLRSVKAPAEPQPVLDVQSIIAQLQQSPELLSVLTSLISNQSCK